MSNEEKLDADDLFADHPIPWRVMPWAYDEVLGAPLNQGDKWILQDALGNKIDMYDKRVLKLVESHTHLLSIIAPRYTPKGEETNENNVVELKQKLEATVRGQMELDFDGTEEGD